MIFKILINSTRNSYSYKQYKKFINSKLFNNSRLAIILDYTNSKKSPSQNFQTDFVGDHNMC